MLKKSTVVLSSSGGLQGIYNSTSASSTSSRLFRNRKPLVWLHQKQCREYAMVANGPSSNLHENTSWPELASANAIPTPYQIFDQRKDAPYSKRRFYELVKMYHPDRYNSNGISGGLSYATKLERYRLIIAANEILSDPVKRRAYDSYGAGWNEFPRVESSHKPSKATGGCNTHNWGRGARGPSSNATWEDWERWYQRDEKSKQQSAYISNGTFLWLIAIFATLGGIGQATRAEKQSVSVLEKRETLHREIGKELGRRRKESATSGDPRERIRAFLRLRNHYEYHLLDLPGDQDQRLLSGSQTLTRAATMAQPADIASRQEREGTK